MIHLNIKANVDFLIADLRAAGDRNAKYAVRWAANATAQEVAVATTDAIQRKFAHSPRGLTFLLKHVKVLNSNSKLTRSLVGKDADLSTKALVGVVPPEGKGQIAGWQNYRGSLLPMLERGGPTPGPRVIGGRPELGRYSVPARSPRDRSRIPLDLYPMNLGLQARRGISGSLMRGNLKGERRTFVVPGSRHAGVVFQRFGRGKYSGIIPIFTTRQQAVLPGRHFFFPTAVNVVRARMADHLRRALPQAMFGKGSYRGFAENAVTQGPAR